MNDRESMRSSVKAVWLAIAGVIGIVIYFFLMSNSPSVSILKPKYSKKQFMEGAGKIFKMLNLTAGRDRFYESYSARIDDNVYRYAQYYKRKHGHFPGIPLGYWRMEWRDKLTNAPGSRRHSASISVTFDFQGNLTGFHASPRFLELDSRNRKAADDAYMDAKFFLEGLNISTDSLHIVKRDRKETHESTTHELILAEKRNALFPYLRKQYRFTVVNDTIAGFHSRYIPNLSEMGGKASRFERTVSYLLLSATWLGIFIVLLVNFIKKLRRDELEFRRALAIGLGVAGLILLSELITNWGNWANVLAGGGIGGAFVLLLVLIIFPIADSRSRETWPEKLEVMDVLMQRKGMVRETGTAILHSFFITGMTMLLLGGTVFLCSGLGIGHLSFPLKMIGVLLDFPRTFSNVADSALIGLLAGFLLLVFWPAYLKIKLRSGRSMFVLLMLSTFLFTGPFMLFFNPMPLGIVMLLPAALAWVIFLFKYDAIALLLGLMGSFFFCFLGLAFLMPENILSGHGILVMVFLLLFLLMGIYLAFRRRSVKDYETYIPDYVARIAERERFLKELEIARGVQMRFLPQKVPEFPSLEIVSLCQPAMEVGGDYYDFIQMDKRHMSVLIGDVSGKGVSAAFYMTMVKGIIKTLSKKTKEPATLLAEANEIFYENAPRDVFITIIYGIFDLQDQVLNVASAGHNPLIIWRKDTGETELFNPKGIALGLDKGDRYRSIIEEKRIPIDEGDVVVFYTDGVSEAMNMDQEIFGEERLRKVIERFARLTPQQLQERIVHEVSRFSGKAPQHDDFTMVVVKIKNKT